jgi:ATP-binding cassette, subfamily B, bacterial
VTFDSVSFAYHDQESSPGDPSALAEHMPASESAAHAPGAPASAGMEYQRTLQQEAELLKEQEMVLCDISFHLAPGRVLGLLGRTGSGKTTLTRLLFRLYDTDEGAIRLGSQGRSETGDPGSSEINIKDIPVQELRRSIGMVTQNIQLFHATVRENLTFFDASIPDERILQAIHDLGLSRWFDALPNGLDTELESGGGSLSAGEAQLLAFTRIFLHDPGLVILDEATSRLDPATEHMIEQAVDRLVRGRTAIIVAHRLGTVQRADNILVLENGEILEYGERARLAEDPSTRFYRLLETGLEEVLA